MRRVAPGSPSPTADLPRAAACARASRLASLPLQARVLRSGPAGHGPDAANMLPRAHRLYREAEYREAYRAGHTARGPLVTCVVRAVPDDTRLGVVASRRVGGAVERNRAKRRLRHAALEIWPMLPERGHHIVLIATTSTGTVDYRRLVHEILSLLSELGVVSSQSMPRPSADR